MDDAVSHAITHARKSRGADDTCNDWLTDVAMRVDSDPTNSSHEGGSRLEPRTEFPGPAAIDCDTNSVGPSTAAQDHHAREHPSHPQVPHARHVDPEVDDDEITILTVLASDPITNTLVESLNTHDLPLTTESRR